ncbi:hypothetical protein F8M41_015438 [Gigaspora margarita]|uniref:Uncharacterized protein n=1 Tax=Gigaspora margarita TaxID=4874 RepID=A0A8H4AQN5_GIGMA|nr:hypothetical protein F8M41_015438 [Gigaspora margarita]
MDSNPQNRPTAEQVYSIINRWKIILESENLTDEETDIKKKFDDADSIIKKLSLNSLSSSNQNIYYSTQIDTQKIIESLKGHIQSSQHSQSYSGKTIVPLTSDLSHEEKLPKNFDGPRQSSQSYSGCDLAQLTQTPKSDHFKFSSDEEKSPKNLKEKASIE